MPVYYKFHKQIMVRDRIYRIIVLDLMFLPSNFHIFFEEI